METVLIALALMVGVVGVSVSLVQLMHWSEAKRASLMHRTIAQAYREGYEARKGEEQQ